MGKATIALLVTVVALLTVLVLGILSSNERHAQDQRNIMECAQQGHSLTECREALTKGKP